jgi:anti-anti-sigma regulatory factor
MTAAADDVPDMPDEQKYPPAVQTHTITLPEKLDVRAAIALKQELSLAVLNGVAVVLDAGKVLRMSSSGCQLIVSFALLMKELRRSFTLQSPSKATSSALSRLGLMQIIQTGA